ncbi:MULTISPECIES: thioesterase domain-containing protein [Brucella]|jgi:thioesterase domain-containing protein|uniref:Lipase n=1 Tax=Brucella anthropi TaxID=529 RepID=A0A6I0D7Y4_BRUAN|nr:MULTISPECIES: thioesterase domain-containing protein [Brucella/Ochrobactrum group]MCR5941233.1 lipase [Ochrobactrum sp. XJ1]KAB2736052.1 lipase [Brucella anthropi]KAB2764405.1 lipase [Brucella anthropi]KAB2780656.1 lipase [Brucella anthropi]KAB2797433.1 lipase [Brucella anthropi]
MTSKPNNFRPKSLTRRGLLFAGAAFALYGSPAQAAPKTSSRISPEADVYLLRGFGDVFSTGIDEIGKQLQANGVDAHVEGHQAWRFVLNQILADQRKNPRAPVVLIGHSLGANAVIDIATALEKKGIQVTYMATFAATAPAPLPGNIKRVVNFYFKQHGWGLPLAAGPRFKGNLNNRDFSGMKDIGHFNIEKQRPLQDEVVRNVLSIVRSR